MRGSEQPSRPLIAELGRVAAELDPVPDLTYQVAYRALALRDVDAELAELVDDTALAASAATLAEPVNRTPPATLAEPANSTTPAAPATPAHPISPAPPLLRANCLAIARHRSAETAAARTSLKGHRLRPALVAHRRVEAVASAAGRPGPQHSC
jgi:hypothetical protein